MSTGTQTEIQYKIAEAIPDYLADHVRMGTASAVVYALADAGFEIVRKHKPGLPSPGTGPTSPSVDRSVR